MRILVIGREGQLARSLAQAAGERSALSVVCAGHQQADLTQRASLQAALQRHAPDLVINAAAYTAVDNAEVETELAMAANALGPGHLAELCATSHVPLIHVSTDYVFDGTLDRPYREDDTPAPIGSYGASKLEGERKVAAALARHVILRTAWVHSPWGKNFVKTMLSLGATREEVSVVADQHGCPTYAPHLAQVCLDIAVKVASEGDASPLWGTYHCAGSGETTWWGFAAEIFRLAEQRGLRPVRVKPITTAEFPTRTRRPANSRLDCSKLANNFGLRLPAWDVGAEACVEAIMAAQQAG